MGILKKIVAAFLIAIRTSQQSIAIFGHIIERDPTFSLGSISPTAGNQPSKPPISLAIGS